MNTTSNTKPGLFEQQRKQKDTNKNAKAVIQHNFLNNKNIFVDKKDYLKEKLLFSLITFIILLSTKALILLFFTHICALRALIVLLEGPFLFILFYSIFTVLAFLLSKEAKWRIQFQLLKNNSILLALCISLGINCSYLYRFKSFETIFMEIFIFNKKFVPEIKYNILYEWTKFICFNTYPFLLLYTLRKLILEYLNYRIHYKFHKKRIVENDKLAVSMHQLNEYTHQETVNDISQWASHIFSCLTKEQKETLNIEDFILIFNEKEGKILFELFDINQNKEIDREEFIKIYENIFSERKALRDSLEEVSNSINKLGTLIIAFYVILLFYLFLLANFPGVSLFINFVFIAGVYISGKTISELMNSIIFIFIIRPYDIEDKLEINNTIYTVKKIGLLYTDLENNGEIITQSNDSLRKFEIKNFRNIEFIIYPINRKIQTKQLKSLSEYKKRVRNYLFENPTKFRPEFELTNLDISEKTVAFDLIIRVNAQFQELTIAKKRRDEMVIFLHRIEEVLFKE